MSKRQSTAPAAPKPPTSLSSSVTISDHTSLTGTNLITVRSDSVLHPRSKIIATNGPVSIGSCCIISERSSIGLQSASTSQTGVTLEDYVVVEVGAEVEAKSIGEGSLIEVKAKVGKGAVIGKVLLSSISSRKHVANNE
jgi:dynactin-6